jgi:hypothetical protein
LARKCCWKARLRQNNNGMKNLLRAALLCLLLAAVWLLLQASDWSTRVRSGLAQSPQPPDGRFGVVESYEDPVTATDLGVAWTRVRFHWAYVQAEGPDTWTPRISEDQINGELEAGRTVVGILIGIPDWARDVNRLPLGLWLPYDDPGNTWANYVRAAVGRYNGRIDHWVIWNEPDIADPTTPGHTWDGTIEDFIQLQRVAYLVAKESNPDAVIHLAAFTHFWDPGYFNRFLTELVTDPDAAVNNYYFDIATAHLYFQPNSIYEIIQSFYGDMARHGLWKPIWLMETNAPPLNDPTWPVPNWTLSVTLDEQAAFMPQVLASAMAAGTQRIAIYKLKDTETDRLANPEPFGLIRADGSRRPAFTTYQVATGYMAGVTGARRERWNEVGQIRLAQADRSTTVLFARLPMPQVAEVEAVAETAVLVDMWGTRRNITAQDGFFRVELPPALCTQPIGDYCMIGGTTYYLVQVSDGGRPPANLPTPGDAPLLLPGETADSFPLDVTPTPTQVATAVPASAITLSPTARATMTPLPVTATLPVPTMTPEQAELSEPAAIETSVSQAGYWLLGLAFLLAIGLIWYGIGKRPLP